jgi:hypothetical protein
LHSGGPLIASRAGQADISNINRIYIQNAQSGEVTWLSFFRRLL